LDTVLLISGGRSDLDTIKGIILEYKPDYYVGADSGLAAYRRLSFDPDFAVGDFDSLPQEDAEYFLSKPNTKKLKPEKDFTDTEVCVEEIIRLNPKRVIIAGATGTRFDHTFANVSLLKMFCDNDIEAYIIDENNRISVKNGSVSLRKSRYPYVSLMPLGDSVTNLTLKGFKYNADGISLTQGISLGISNEIIEDVATIDFETGYLLVMESID